VENVIVIFSLFKKLLLHKLLYRNKFKSFKHFWRIFVFRCWESLQEMPFQMP